MKYRHYKGGLYTLLFFGMMESDKTRVAIYRDDKTKRVWVRPAVEFHKKFTSIPDEA